MFAWLTNQRIIDIGSRSELSGRQTPLYEDPAGLSAAGSGRFSSVTRSRSAVSSPTTGYQHRAGQGARVGLTGPGHSGGVQHTDTGHRLQVTGRGQSGGRRLLASHQRRAGEMTAGGRHGWAAARTPAKQTAVFVCPAWSARRPSRYCSAALSLSETRGGTESGVCPAPTPVRQQNRRARPGAGRPRGVPLGRHGLCRDLGIRRWQNRPPTVSAAPLFALLSRLVRLV